jgi:sulfate permease, SulP family
MMFKKLLPDWFKQYQSAWLAGDVIAGAIVTVMLIPQSLAYAMLAGLPPQAGLYASLLPIFAYALFGSSMTLAVGPVAVASLMTATALAPLASAGSVDYAALAVILALLSGVMLFVFGLLRLGFLAYFLSHPVISGFISGSAVVIAIGQLKYIFGIQIPRGGIITTLSGLVQGLPTLNVTTTLLGCGALLFLFFARRYLATVLKQVGLSAKSADLAAKLAPMLVVIVATLIVKLGQLDQQELVSVVGSVPSGLPSLAIPTIELHDIQALWLPALLISLVGFVESVSVAQSLALKRNQRITPNKELLGIGAANIASALSGGYPVTGGFARSVVNFSAGANTPAAGVVSAIFMAIVVAVATSWFYYLPHAVLAATIIVAVIGLIDFKTLQQSWHYDRADAISLILTFLGVIFLGVEEGIVIGVVLSLAVVVWRSSRPHMAVVGRVPGTEHFRNIDRHDVELANGLIALRIDESIYFANAQVLEDKIESLVAESTGTRAVLLIMSAVNQLDSTALGMLDELEKNLQAKGISLQFAEIKGPVLDRLHTTDLGQRMHDRIFLSTHQAFQQYTAKAQA